MDNSLFDDYKRTPTPRSKLFPEERLFRARVYQILESASLNPEIERGVKIDPDFSQRWDIAIPSITPTGAVRSIIIECKVKGGASEYERAIGQCVCFLATRCCENVILCYPSDLLVPLIIEQVCQQLNIHLASESSIKQTVTLIQSKGIYSVSR